MSRPLLVCYGGSFDPVHNGHLAIARAARDHLHAEVALLPARDPPHKDATHADAEQRAQLLALAIAGEDRLSVDRRELRRAGPSYSVDTLTELRKERGEAAPLAWLLGADSLLRLHTWHRWRELFQLAHVICVQRPGMAGEVSAAQLREQAPLVLNEINQRWLPPQALAASPAGGFSLLPLAELRPESSTELRRRIREQAEWRDWVPPAVAAQLIRLNLYRSAAVILGKSLSSDHS